MSLVLEVTEVKASVPECFPVPIAAVLANLALAMWALEVSYLLRLLLRWHQGFPFHWLFHPPLQPGVPPQLEQLAVVEVHLENIQEVHA